MAAARKFHEAGAEARTVDEPYPVRMWMGRDEVLGWDALDHDVYCDNPVEDVGRFTGRCLTYAELMGEGSAGGLTEQQRALLEAAGQLELLGAPLAAQRARTAAGYGGE